MAAQAESAGSQTGTRSSTQLKVGDEFGTRYRITRFLGMGGMGAVYQAWDNELGLQVALKTIRPDRETQSTERKFKRELVLARTVTHKNVIRIHDLGELNGTKYITMQYVEGPDLRQVLSERKRLPIDEALRLGRDIALGLEAAHDAKVVHRDLKPGNILIGPEGAIITDFGIAHSIGKADDSGVSGTVRYMAPEQARGLAVDHRADIYSFGLILHEMIVGRQWSGDMATLSVIRKKISGDTKSSTATDVARYSELPAGVQEVLARCLPTDPDARFATTSELVQALRSLDDRGLPRPLTSIKIPAWLPLVGGRSIERSTAVAIAVGALAVPLASAAVYFSSSRVVVPPTARPPISVLVADFDNRSGQAVFNGLIEQALGVTLEGAPFISAYPRLDAQRLVDQVAKGQRLDVERARIVAQREGINAVLAGAIVPDGSGYRISLQVIDPVPGTVLSQEEQRAATRDDVLRVIGELASETRAALGDTTPESARLSAGETFTAASLDAAALYTQGQELLQASRYRESIPLFRKATELDSSFGRAFSSWALAEYYVGNREETERLFKRAFALTDRMTEREKYRTFGTYYLTVGQAYQEAVTNYSKLVELYPADRTGHGNLAVAQFYLLDFARATESSRRALELYPTSLKTRANYALFAAYSGDFAAAKQRAEEVVKADPAYFPGYVPLALATTVIDRPAAAGTYERMAATGARGASRAAAGLADLALYEGRFAEAETIATEALAKDVESGDRASAAVKHILLAESLAARGLTARAVAEAEKALDASRTESTMLAAASVFVRAGRDAAARGLATELAGRTQGYSRAYAQIVESMLASGAAGAATRVDRLRAAQRSADLWQVHYLLGVAYVEAGRFPEAIAEFDVCVKRRGEATAIFLDDVPSFRYLAPLPYWQGRAQEGLGLTAPASASYKQYLELRPTAEDPLTKDARARQSKLGA
jgi:tetratricopeptide (TPR) repeat protein